MYIFFHNYLHSKNRSKSFRIYLFFLKYVILYENTMNLKSSVGEIWLANNISVSMKCTIYHIYMIDQLIISHAPIISCIRLPGLP